MGQHTPHTTSAESRLLTNMTDKHKPNLSYMLCPVCNTLINVNVHRYMFWADHINSSNHGCPMMDIVSDFHHLSHDYIEEIKSFNDRSLVIMLNPEIIDEIIKFRTETHTVIEFESFVHMIYNKYNIGTTIAIQEF